METLRHSPLLPSLSGSGATGEEMADRKQDAEKRSAFIDVAAPVGMIIAVAGGLVAIVIEFSM